jgi:hypothetical protein
MVEYLYNKSNKAISMGYESTKSKHTVDHRRKQLPELQRMSPLQETMVVLAQTFIQIVFTAVCENSGEFMFLSTSKLHVNFYR